MALGKGFGTALKDIVTPDKKKKTGKDFMNGLKEFVVSPGGILTITLFVITMWYVHKQLAPKK